MRPIVGPNHKGGVKAKTLAEKLTKDSYHQTYRLKQQLIDSEIFQRKCNNCNNTEWLNAPIPLELDHISGDRFDNRLENLRLLCPNCHAQTDTYRGKNKKK